MGKEKMFFDKMFCSGQYNLEIHFQIQNTENKYNLEIYFQIQNTSTILISPKNETIYHSLIL